MADARPLNFLLKDQGYDDYEITSTLLGEGKFGRVYLGRQKSRNEKIAIKLVPLDTLRRNSRLRKYIDLEVNILGSLNCHNIVQLIDSFELGDYRWILLEYCNSKDLGFLLDQYKREHNRGLPEAQVQKYMCQLSEAIAAMREKNIIHRDLKPENICLHKEAGKDDFTLKVTDFGMARQFQEENLMDSNVGTPIYNAPEILNNDTYTEKVDLYSIGVLMYKALTNKFPFVARSRELLLEKIKTDIFEIPTYISEECAHLLSGLLQRQAEDRFSHEQFIKHPFITGIRMASSSIIGIESVARGMQKMELKKNPIEDEIKAFQKMESQEFLDHSFGEGFAHFQAVILEMSCLAQMIAVDSLDDREKHLECSYALYLKLLRICSQTISLLIKLKDTREEIASSIGLPEGLQRANELQKYITLARKFYLEFLGKARNFRQTLIIADEQKIDSLSINQTLLNYVRYVCQQNCLKEWMNETHSLRESYEQCLSLLSIIKQDLPEDPETRKKVLKVVNSVRKGITQRLLQI